MTSRRRLIVSGDDFGVAEEVNEGILRAHRDGILGQTSLMVTGAAAAHAVEQAKATPSLAVGLHLVLAQGRPAAPPAAIPELVRADGAFRDTPIRNGLRYAWAYVRAAGRAQLVREIDAARGARRPGSARARRRTPEHASPSHGDADPARARAARRHIRHARVAREPAAALRYDRRRGAECFEGRSRAAAYASSRLRAAGIVSSDRVFGMHQTGTSTSVPAHVIATLPPG
jgi:hypothetical protein